MKNQRRAIPTYVQGLGIEKLALEAAIDSARRSAAAEHRLLATQGIMVGKINLTDLEPFLGRGSMLELE